MPKERSITIRIDSDLLEDLKRVAKSDDRSLGYIIRSAVRIYIDMMEAANDDETSAEKRVYNARDEHFRDASHPSASKYKHKNSR